MNKYTNKIKTILFTSAMLLLLPFISFVGQTTSSYASQASENRLTRTQMLREMFDLITYLKTLPVSSIDAEMTRLQNEWSAEVSGK